MTGHGEAGYKGATKSAKVSEHVELPEFNNSTIVIIGMRGAGKSHMGKAAASSLNRIFVDTDEFFVQKMGESIAEYVAKNNWTEFRKLEVSQLKELLDTYPTGHVISCGGGIVETTEGRKLLEEWTSQSKHRVVHLTRPIDEVVDYLNRDKSRPALGEEARSIWNRRRQYYKGCSNAEFFIVSDDAFGGWKSAEQDFSKFMKFMTLNAGTFNITKELSFFLCLTFPDIRGAVKVLDVAADGADAFELRVDLLKEWTDEFIGEQIALIRRHSDLPIIFTVRTKSQGGRFPDNDLQGAFDLLLLGLKHQCEFIDVEVLDSKCETFLRLYDSLVKIKGRSHFIASFHDFSGTAIWDQSIPGGLGLPVQNCVVMSDKYLQLHPFGDSIKLVGKANSLADNFALHRFVNHTVPSLGLKPVKPLIAINMSMVGQVSRALNTYMTPVTHPSLPVSAAPGQLSVKQIHETRTLLGLIPSKKFFLFGFPIAHSMSPTMHNTGFRTIGLPHNYSVSESSDFSHVKAVLAETMKEKTFGGASVTIPHKESVIKSNILSKLSDAAAKIGAVNTITVSANGEELFGDNTDWLGIRKAILKRVGGVEEFHVIGAVIGAGGTARAACFALQSLNAVILRVWNRTAPKAEALAAEFGGEHVTELENLLDGSALASNPVHKPTLLLVVSSVPGASQADFDIDGLFTCANADAPVGSVGVFVEMAYRPRQTKIIEYLRLVERSNISWSCVEGVEVLVEQGLEQFSRWTGRTAPRKAIEDAVYANYK
ncbi:3-dehydroquinate dehydratase (3-dehydroquinase) [Entophlyctis sp. JEL0112]|nr:3-dehydroquinate dehydratase (3-dehydroquinase) [Entophlyctis sp. JEL0112]